MKHSDSIASLAAALVQAQGDIKAVEKAAVNPHFKSRYATLDSIVAMARPALSKHGLAIIASAPSDDGNALRVETMLVHSSGEWLSNEVCIPLSKKDPQGAGAAVTYGRRFGLSSLLSLTSEEDDDGNAASQPQPAKRAEPKRERPVDVVAPNAPAVDPLMVACDLKVAGRRMGVMTDDELHAFIAAKDTDEKALRHVQGARLILASRTPDATVARMQAKEDAFQDTLPASTK